MVQLLLFLRESSTGGRRGRVVTREMAFPTMSGTTVSLPAACRAYYYRNCSREHDNPHLGGRQFAY